MRPLVAKLLVKGKEGEVLGVRTWISFQGINTVWRQISAENKLWIEGFCTKGACLQAAKWISSLPQEAQKKKNTEVLVQTTKKSGHYIQNCRKIKTNDWMADNALHKQKIYFHFSHSVQVKA